MIKAKSLLAGVLVREAGVFLKLRELNPQL